MTARRLSGRGRALGGGVVAGVLAGVALALVLVAMAIAAGHDAWMPLKGAAAPLLQDRAQAPGFDAEAIGVGIAGHFAISIVWGVLFAAIFYGLSRGATIEGPAVIEEAYTSVLLTDGWNCRRDDSGHLVAGRRE